MVVSIKRKTDRILELERIDPKKKEVGLFDPRVFTGDNNLRIVLNPMTSFWTIKYDRGIPPGPLRTERFTSFNEAYRYTEDYMKTKNIKIVGIKD